MTHNRMIKIASRALPLCALLLASCGTSSAGGSAGSTGAGGSAGAAGRGGAGGTAVIGGRGGNAGGSTGAGGTAGGTGGGTGGVVACAPPTITLPSGTSNLVAGTMIT